jgi:hypothetical protein
MHTINKFLKIENQESLHADLCLGKGFFFSFNLFDVFINKINFIVG